MSEKTKTAEKYADIILHDERDKIVAETPTIYTDDKIERLYEFADGAVVKYEWQSFSSIKSEPNFNHRFSLVYLPSPNPNNLKKGIIKVIDYPNA